VNVNRLLVVIGLTLVLVACERAQTAPSARKPDAEPWNVAQNPFVVPGWKANDEASWVAQMRERAAAQNEYLRVSPRR
jgi:hypothetical protein